MPSSASPPTTGSRVFVATRTTSPLPAIRIPFSTRIARHRPASFLVTNRFLGRRLDQVVGEFVHTLRAARPPGAVHIGTSSEATQLPGNNRTLRIAHILRPGHSLAIDVTFRAQGDDLYVRCHLLAKMIIAKLHAMLFLTAFLVIWSVLSTVFLLNTDLQYALGQSFAQKYFTNPQAGVAVMVYGWEVDAAPGAPSPYRRVKPWAVADYFRADPVLFLQSLALVPSILAGVSAAALMLIPRSACRYPCLWLGWPTPDDFDAALLAHKGWVERLLYQTLEARHGVTKTDLIEVPVD